MFFKNHDLVPSPIADKSMYVALATVATYTCISLMDGRQHMTAVLPKLLSSQCQGHQLGFKAQSKNIGIPSTFCIVEQ